jgi:pantoate kinase
MEGAAIARSPGHISGYFRRIPGGTPGETGSCGAGIVVAEGVTARAVPAPAPAVKIVSPYPLPPIGRVPLIETAMERLGVSAEVTTTSTLPAGAGFGLSAAALLASISALSALFDLGLPGREIASLAHEIEVTHRTGLGDVAACQGGGVECRTGPGVGAGILRIPAPGQVVHAVTFGPIPTPAILGDPARMERIALAFPGRCPRDIGDFFSLSRSFAGGSGLVTPRVGEALAACDRAGVPASMTMLGEGVFALGDEAAPVLAPFGKVFRLRVADRGFGPAEVGR